MQPIGGMIPINDLHGLGLVHRDQIPDPRRAIADKDQFVRPVGLSSAGTKLGRCQWTLVRPCQSKSISEITAEVDFDPGCHVK